MAQWSSSMIRPSGSSLLDSNFTWLKRVLLGEVPGSIPGWALFAILDVLKDGRS